MESKSGVASHAGTPRASPRSRSGRVTPRSSFREVASRPPTASILAAAAAHLSYVTAPLPPPIKGHNRQSAAAKPTSEEPASWTSHTGLLPPMQTLVRTDQYADLTIDAFLRDPLGWLLRLVSRLQAVLKKLFAGSRAAKASSSFSSSSAQRFADSVTSLSSKAAAPAATAPVSGTTQPNVRRTSSARVISDRAAATKLVATQVAPTPPQQPSIPVAALALTTAAVLGYACFWAYKRWNAVLEGQRENEQRIAVKKDILARQKQRFQRALVVDSVNLELPPIKDMDVQPGPVRVEKIISQQAPQARKQSTPRRNGSMPGVAGEHLRQWQQFMAASRATEVTDVSKNRGKGSAGQTSDRPYVALDDRMLADLSERIRRANEVTAAGGAAPPMPVITFEQLYANNHESDDEAMARRAAERKARWQKQQPGATGGVGKQASGGRPGQAEKKDSPAGKPHRSTMQRLEPTGQKESVVASVGKVRPKMPNPDNPFAVGLFSSPNDLPSSTGADTTSASSRTTVAPHAAPPGVQPPSRPVVPRLDLSGLVMPKEESPSSRPRLHDCGPAPMIRTTVSDSVSNSTSPTELQTQHFANDSASVQGDHTLPIERRELQESTSSSNCSVSFSDGVKLLEATAAVDAVSVGAEVVEGVRRRSSPSSRQEPESIVLVLPELQDDSTTTRVKRAPAAGPLRTPETQSPALARLMRRPSVGPGASEKNRSVQPEMQLA